MIGMPGPTELIIILVIVLIIFGGAKLKNLGRDLGGAISEFKSSVKNPDGDEEADNGAAAEATSAPAANTANSEENGA